jgi:uncharacterized protein (UPF0276 family)
MLADMNVLTDLSPSVGIGLKPEHYAQVLESAPASIHPSSRADHFRHGWVEVHPQNYFSAGGPPHRWLSAIAENYPLSFHSVGLSLGSAQGHDREELDQLALLCDRYAPAQVSDHLSWSGSANNRYPDLLPVPYTEEALSHFTRQVSIAQDRLKRRTLIENPSRYLAFAGLERLFAQLPPAQAQAIEFVKIEGLSVAEASRACGQSESQVKVNIHRGLKKLTAMIEKA